MFSQEYKIVEQSLLKIGIELTNEYDGFIVKELKASNTLDLGRTTNQTHIAITGEQMDIFPYVRSLGYFDVSYSNQDADLKKYYVLQLPIYLHKTNIEYLGGNTNYEIQKVYASIVRSRRDGAADQLQMSMINLDSDEFVSFRKLCHTGDYLLLLKRKHKLFYDIYCIKADDVLEDFKKLNNHFYKDTTNTVVKLDNVIKAKNDTTTSLIGYNKIYYGIPGCGKSYHIENTVLEGVDKKNNVFRTTFYLDYSNSDFIGQIYPVVDGNKVKYEPIPGPFTKALERALTNKGEMIYLVIEEINRGNAAAIFGDTFQLLDRLKENKNGRVIGDSEYPISNAFIEDYLRKQNVEFTPGNIYIPHNLTLLATMNTSDQNVFPLDTAFKRRWNREKVTSDWGEENKIKGLYIPYTSVTWETFVKTINKEMIDKSAKEDAPISEDKQMGAYFADKSMLSKDPNDKDGDKIDSFANNVLDYLFNDVTKFNHKILFEEQILTTDKIYERIDAYKKEILEEPDNVGAEQAESQNIFSEIFTKDISNELVGNAKKVDDDND